MESGEISDFIWRAKYRLCGEACEQDIGQTFLRVANAVAAAERESGVWARRFSAAMSGFSFLPGGRILAGAGSARDVTLFNCFVAGQLDDSIKGILRGLSETARTMHEGGGVGIDFSPLRPAGAPAIRTGSAASGPVSFMHLWDALCDTLLSTTSRRGAMMGTLACDHPDVRLFIDAKKCAGSLRNFNLSVLVSDAFMEAARDDGTWMLRFPSAIAPQRSRKDSAPTVTRQVSARQLFRHLAATAFATAEPGVLFVDTINRNDNLAGFETITATNPCGEVPLPPHGACDLGSINLTALVRDPFGPGASLDEARLREIAATAVRFLDDVIDISHFPLPEQAQAARASRRIGLGITGLADTLAMLGLRYDSDTALEFAAATMRVIRDAAYRTSCALAREKAAFPLFERDSYLGTPFVQNLPADIRDLIASHGIRNSHLLSIAPAGTISLLAGNVSSGIEPIYALEAARTIRDAHGRPHEFQLHDPAYARWRATARNGAHDDVFVSAAEISADAHLRMVVALQPFVDNAISKTINLAADAGVGDVADTYMKAWAGGAKGCTVFRPGAVAGQVIKERRDAHCCHVDREAD